MSEFTNLAGLAIVVILCACIGALIWMAATAPVIDFEQDDNGDPL